MMKRTFHRSLLASLLLVAGTSQAGLQEDLSGFFNDMSYASNTTSAKAWQGQAARYVSGGSFYARTGNKNIQLISISLPSISSGCGGIDVYLGAFSFINSDQIQAFVKKIMANAAGYFFDLALETTVPELKAAKDFLQKLAADMNRFNMSSCQAAVGIVGGLTAGWMESQQKVCQDIAGQSNMFADWAASRQGCTTGGSYNNVSSKASGSDKDRVLNNINLMWDALSTTTLSSSQELRQFAMSISGTVVYDDNSTLHVYPSLAANRDIVSAMMHGGNAEVYVCDNNNKCLAPTVGKVTISQSNALVTKVRDILASIESKAVNDDALTESEKQFINSTSVPILSWIVDQASLSVSQTLFAQLADYIACDIYLQYLQNIIKVSNGALVNRAYDEENMKKLREGITSAEQALVALRADIQIKEDALLSAQQQIRFIRQQVSSKMTDRVIGNYKFNRMN